MRLVGELEVPDPFIDFQQVPGNRRFIRKKIDNVNGPIHAARVIEPVENSAQGGIVE